jgi:hypothetical protein
MVQKFEGKTYKGEAVVVWFQDIGVTEGGNHVSLLWLNSLSTKPVRSVCKNLAPVDRALQEMDILETMGVETETLRCVDGKPEQQSLMTASAFRLS